MQGSVQEMTGPWRCRDKDRSEECFESGISRTVLGSGLPLMSKGTRVCRMTPGSVALANEQMAAPFIQIRKMEEEDGEFGVRQVTFELPLRYLSRPLYIQAWSPA